MAAVQVYVVPVTVELNATLLAVPPHIVCGDAEPTGVGLTVIVKVFEGPVQLAPEKEMVTRPLPTCIPDVVEPPVTPSI